MDQPRDVAIRYLLEGEFRLLALSCWGDPHAQPVVCVHGLTRNGRDFDALAQALQDRYYVVCPDMPGRGRSAWLPEPALYNYATYALAMSHVLAFIDRPVLWVGTSMGGIIGMMLAAAPGHRLRAMVLNDIGPFIPQAAMARIQGYLGNRPVFADVDAAAAHLREIHAPFGDLSESQWRHLAAHGTRRLPDGTLALHYDPGLTLPLLAAPAAATDLSAFWDRIDIPLLTLRGASSDLLLAETFAAMGEKSALHTVEGAGHAPALMDAATIGVIRAFLDAQSA